MNDYYSASPLTPNTVARAADVNTRFVGVEAAFDLLPPPIYIQQNRLTYAVDSGAANAVVANPAIPITSYNDGLRLTVKAAAPNTGPTTINVSGLGVKQIVRSDGTPLEIGDIVAGQILDVTYDTVIGAFRLSMAFAELSPAGVLAKLVSAGPVALTSNLSTTGTITTTGVGGIVAPKITIGGVAISTVTEFGKGVLSTANASTARTLLGLGTMATASASTYAPLASPALTGTPTAPTPTVADNSTKLATTAFVQSAVSGISLSGYARLAESNVFTQQNIFQGLVNAQAGLIVPSGAYASWWADNTLAPPRKDIYAKIETLAPLASPVFSGTVSVSGQLTVSNEAYGSGWNGATSVPTKNAVYDEMQTKAGLDGPSFTGTVTAPTASVGTNSTVVATTAFVKSQNYLVSSDLNGLATLSSPVFTGAPLAPTPSASDNSTKIATTAFVKNQGFADASAIAAKADLAAPAFTGAPTAPTPTAPDNSTRLATTAFVKNQSYLTTATAASTYAPLASPALTGAPTAPTATPGTNNSQIATTAFVKNEGYITSSALSAYATNASPALTGTPTAPTATAANNSTQIATTAFVKNQSYITSSDISGLAPLASPALTGNPTAPTQSLGNNSTRLATTAYVQSELSNDLLDVTSFTTNLAPLNTHNKVLLRFTGSTVRTITLNSGPSDGMSCILVNRGTANLTLSGTMYINGASATAASATLAQGAQVTLIHEGGGTWIVQGTGVS